MKKLLSITLLLAFLSLGNLLVAQDDLSSDSVEMVSDTSVVEEIIVENEPIIEEEIEVVEEEVKSKT